MPAARLGSRNLTGSNSHVVGAGGTYATPAARTNESNPEGTDTVIKRAEDEVIMKACGNPRGRNNADPAVTWYSRSPASAVISPSSR
jgi:hypothetical protein